MSASRESELLSLMEQAVDVQAAKGSRAANQVLIDSVGLDLRSEIGEPYFREALDYHLGLVYAHLRQPEKAAAFLDRSNTMPANGGDLIFSEHVRASIDVQQEQDAARQRGMPPILIASMPRSGSASLTVSLSEALQIPILRFSAGDFPNYIVIPRWLARFSLGGAVSHDHFGATAFNRAVLAANNVRDIFVLIRDPRAASSSFAKHVKTQAGNWDASALDEQRIVSLCEDAYVPWVRAWLAVCADPSAGLNVHWIRYNDICASLSSVVRRALALLEPDYPALRSYVHSELAETKVNFVTGNDESWRAGVSKEGKERMWNSIPDALIRLLDLRP